MKRWKSTTQKPMKEVKNYRKNKIEFNKDPEKYIASLYITLVYHIFIALMWIV